MNNFFTEIRKLMCDEEGVTMIEYGLIAALIAIAVITTVFAIGTNLNTLFEKVKNCVTSPPTAPCA